MQYVFAKVIRPRLTHCARSLPVEDHRDMQRTQGRMASFLRP